MSEESSTETQSTEGSESQESNGRAKTVTKAKGSKTTQKQSATKSITQQAALQATQYEFTKIETLMQSGVAQADITRLKEAGIQTVQALAMQTHKQLSQIKGLSEAKVDKLFSVCKDALATKQFVTADQVLMKRQNLLRISTGSNELDNMLGCGGVESQQICEVFGEFRCGKSQLCHTMAVTGQHPRINGEVQRDAYKIVYIDTESTFRPERILQIARRFGANEQETLKNIVVSRVFNHEQQMAALSYLPQLLVQNKFSLIVIDSITALFRTDFTGRGELADRQQKLGQHLSQLIKLAEEYNLVVFITNQVMAQVDGAAMFTADPKKPIGGAHSGARVHDAAISEKGTRGNEGRQGVRQPDAG